MSFAPLVATIRSKTGPRCTPQMTTWAWVWVYTPVNLARYANTLSPAEKLIRETGGRGLWSDSLDAFCRQNQHRTNLIMVSLDWGFNEQLAFLTDGPKLFEPVWSLGADCH